MDVYYLKKVKGRILGWEILSIIKGRGVIIGRGGWNECIDIGCWDYFLVFFWGF